MRAAMAAAEVGDDVMMYHGVTLGGRSLQRGKRHPTVHDGVTLGAGARVLGAVDVGEGERDLPGAGEAFCGAGLEGSAACDSAARKRSRGNAFGE